MSGERLITRIQVEHGVGAPTPVRAPTPKTTQSTEVETW